MESFYLLLGPEKGDKEDFINSIKKELGTFETYKFYGFEENLDQMYGHLTNEDLFADHKLIILEEADCLKEKDAKSLVKVLQNPLSSVTLLILSDETYISKELMALATENQIKRFYEMFDSRKPDWLNNFFRQNGMTIDNQAIETIIERVENNSLEFRTICSQMIGFLKDIKNKTNASYEDVEEFLTHTRQESESTLFSYIAKKDLDGALECFKSLIDSSDSSFQLANICQRLSYYFRRGYTAILNCQTMDTDAALRTKYYDSDKSIITPKEKDTYKAFLRNYSLSATKNCLMLLCQTDLKLKETSTELQQTTVELCLFDIIQHNGIHPQMPKYATM